MSYNYDPSSSRAGSVAGGSGSRSFLDRLSSVGPNPNPVGTNYGSSIFGGGGDDADMEALPGAEPSKAFTEEELAPPAPEDELNPIQRIGRALTRERGVPAILEFEGELVEEIMNRLKQQADMIAMLQSDTKSDDDEDLLSIVQTEIERAKYYVRNYLRTRLAKVEKFAQYIVATPEILARCSPSEATYARRYAGIVAAHYQHSVLDSLPEWLGRLDESSGGVSMVSEPNLKQPVLVYCREDCGEIPLGTNDDGTESIAQLNKGTTHFVRYDFVQRWIQVGAVEVL